MNNRAGSRSVRNLEQTLSERDRAILRSVGEHRFLTTNHLCDLHFWNHASRVSAIRACTRVLARLRDRRILHRIARTVGGSGGGSGSYVWSVGAAGDRVLRSEFPDAAARKRQFEPTLLFLSHTLAVADARVGLEQMVRSGLLESLAAVTEPDNWIVFSDRHGRRQFLKPDLRATLTSEEFEDVEIDLGTESLPVLIRKCLLYQEYRDSGREEKEHGVFPIVLWLIESPRRRDLLLRAIKKNERLEPALFRIAAPSDLIEITNAESEVINH